MAEYLVVNGSDSAVSSVGTAAAYDDDGDQGANAAQVFTAATKGVQGNDITIAFVDDVANPDPPVVTVTGLAISVAIDDGVTLASEVETALEASAAAMDLITVANKGGNDGTGVVVAFAAENLVGGTADVLPAQTQKIVELTDAEAAAFVVAGCGLVPATVSYADRRRLGRTLKYDKVVAIHVAA